MEHAQDRHIELADAVHVFDVGRLHEGVDARVVGQFTAGEGGDAPVDDALSRLEPMAQALIHLLLPAGEGGSRASFSRASAPWWPAGGA